MAIDKNKIEQSAIRYAQKGQYAKAVDEYQKLLAADPKDIRTRLKLLNLYGQMGKKENAIEECRRISDSYAEQGFVPRAIAVWSQAIRLDPNNPDPYRNQGELYLHQKLIGNAIDAFRKAVELLRAQDRLGEAGKLLARMEEMAPGNVAIKMHLAEIYLEEGRFDDFRAEVEKVIIQLKGEGRARKLLAALEGLYQKSGKRPELVKPLADLYVELGEDEKALEVMRVGLAANPQDRDLRLNSIRAHLALGNLTDARKIALAIRDEDPQDLYILEQLAAIAEARGDKDEQVQWYKDIALAYRRQGLTGQEESYFRKVIAICPDDAEAMLSLGGLEVATPSGGQGETKIDQGFFLDLSSEILAEEPPRRDAETEIREGIVEADLYLKYGLDEKALAKLRSLPEEAARNIDVHQRIRDICWRKGDRDEWMREQHLIAKMFREGGKLTEALRAYEAILDVAPGEEEAAREVADLRGVATESAPPAPGLAKGLREADRLIEDEDTGEAISVLMRLQELYPAEAEIAERLKRLGWEGAEPGGAGGEEDFSGLRAELGELEFDVASSIAGFEAVEVSELDDIVREFRSGVAEKLDDSDFSTHYDLGVAYKEMGLLDDALQEFQKAARFTEKAKNAYTSIAMIYREAGKHGDARSALRLALSVPTNTPEDRAAILFELGVLSEDEGDWEGAASSYEKAAAINPGFRDVTQRAQYAKSRMA